MSIRLKPIDQQVIVITGASSGIGLATAESAADQGAQVVLAARSADAIMEVASSYGSNAIGVPCDVADRAQVESVAQAAISHFGRIDTWVNNAALGVYGLLEECDLVDSHRIFEVDYWGVVNGSLAALPRLRRQGGALINVGSEVSEAATPLLGMYVAAKHAVKGFTDCLRIEIEEIEQAPIAVTLIQPTACNTPFPQHARNYMQTEPKLPEPLIDPQQVADAILAAAVSHTRSKKVGLMASVNVVANKFMPGIADRIAAKRIDQLHTDSSRAGRKDALYQSSEAMQAAGCRHPVANGFR